MQAVKNECLKCTFQLRLGRTALFQFLDHEHVLLAMFFTLLSFLLMILLFKMAFKSRAEGQQEQEVCDVPHRENMFVRLDAFMHEL